MKRIVVAEGADLPADLARAIDAAAVRIETHSARDLTALASFSAHQGVVAVADPMPLADWRDLVRSARFVVALDGVEDPRNFGAVVRVADAAGADAVLYPERHSAPLSAATLKAAAGAAEWVGLARVPNLAAALQAAKKAGMWIVGLETSGDPVQSCGLLDERVVLVAGSEGGGLRRRTTETCDAVCSVPMRGEVGSLNVSTALAVVAFRVAELHARDLGR